MRFGPKSKKEKTKRLSRKGGGAKSQTGGLAALWEASLLVLKTLITQNKTPYDHAFENEGRDTIMWVDNNREYLFSGVSEAGNSS